MDTSSYLARLEGLLDGLPLAERQYAIAYYTEYLMDAGPEGAAAAIAALGTPESLAAQIKADVAIRSLTNEPMVTAPEAASAALPQIQAQPQGQPQGQPQPQGHEQGQPANATPLTEASAVPAPQPQAQPLVQPPSVSPPPVSATDTKGKTGGGSIFKTIMVVLLAIFALPIGLPVAIAIIALVISLFAVALSVVVTFFAVGVSLILTGIAGVIVGIALIPVSWPTGLFYIGCGLIVFGLSLLFVVGAYYLMRLTFKGIALLFNTIRKRLSKNRETKQQKKQAQEVNHV